MWKLLVCFSFFAVVASNNVGRSGESLRSLLTNSSREKIHEILHEFNNVTTKQQVAVINDYVDELLEELNKFIMLQKLDPVEMPDIENDFKWRVLFITYRGQLYLTQGWLQGLGSMKRNEDVTVWYEYPNIKIRLPLGYNVLMFDYKYLAKFMGLGPTGNVDGKTVNCRFVIELELDMITLKAKLTNFDLDTVGKISLKFSGQWMTDFLTNFFIYVALPVVKPILRMVIESFVSGGLISVIDFYNGVICNILGNC